MTTTSRRTVPQDARHVPLRALRSAVPRRPLAVLAVLALAALGLSACTQDVAGIDTPLAAPGSGTGTGTGTGTVSSDEYPAVGLVQVAPGVEIEYRDWGGDGPPIVLFTGLGNSAAVFDDLAPRLTDTHRVIGLTRRGFGSSTVTAGGYDVPTRVADDLAALDALGIDRALLVGHSISGDELTGIAQARPDLPVGLVYLDAALDRSDPAKSATDECYSRVPGSEEVLELSPEESREVDGEVQFFGLQTAVRLRSAQLGGPVPLSEIRRQFALGPGGSLQIADRSTATAALSAGTAAFSPDYTGIRVPVTALYGDDADPAVAFPPAALAGPEVLESLRECAAQVAAFKQAAGADRVRAAIPDARVETVPGGPHYFFLGQPERAVDEIRDTAARAGW